MKESDFIFKPYNIEYKRRDGTKMQFIPYSVVLTKDGKIIGRIYEEPEYFILDHGQRVYSTDRLELIKLLIVDHF